MDSKADNINIEDEVRRRAYELWEQYGRPEGCEEEFWLKAEREIMQEKGINRPTPDSPKDASKLHPQKETPPEKATG